MPQYTPETFVLDGLVYKSFPSNRPRLPLLKKNSSAGSLQ